MAETSDTRFLNTCRRLLDIFKAEANWNPSNTLLQIVKLEAQLDAAYPIANDVPAQLAPHKIRINDRQASYAKINPFEVFRDAKEYYKSQYQPNSPQYRAVTAPSMTLQRRSRS